MLDTAKVRVCSFVNTQAEDCVLGGAPKAYCWWLSKNGYFDLGSAEAGPLTNIFQKELQTGSRIRPVTMMSINELEEILPHVSTNSFSWPELLDFRSNGPSGGAFSVHQAIYDLLHAKDLPATRNQAIRKNFDEVLRIIGSRYQPAAG